MICRNEGEMTYRAGRFPLLDSTNTQSCPPLRQRLHGGSSAPSQRVCARKERRMRERSWYAFRMMVRAHLEFPTRQTSSPTPRRLLSFVFRLSILSGGFLLPLGLGRSFARLCTRAWLRDLLRIDGGMRVTFSRIITRFVRSRSSAARVPRLTLVVIHRRAKRPVALLGRRREARVAICSSPENVDIPETLILSLPILRSSCRVSSRLCAPEKNTS